MNTTLERQLHILRLQCDINTLKYTFTLIPLVDEVVLENV